MGTFDPSKERMKRAQALSLMWKLPFFSLCKGQEVADSPTLYKGRW